MFYAINEAIGKIKERTNYLDAVKKYFINNLNKFKEEKKGVFKELKHSENLSNISEPVDD